jgi:type I restriction enzyme, S subunit
VNFQPVRIGDLGRVVTGRTPPAASPQLYGTTYPFITPTDIQGDVRYIKTIRSLSSEAGEAFGRIILPRHAVCVVCIGATIGKICMTDQPSFTNQQINTIVVDRNNFDPHFVFAAARLLQNELQQKAAGAATPIINKSSFENIQISVPDLATQTRIASILSAYDDLIEVNQRRIAILEEMARRLFDEWFVHFRYPGHKLFDHSESKFGSLPHGWQKKKLGDLIFRRKTGSVYTQSNVSATGNAIVVDQSALDHLGFHNNVADHIATTHAPMIVFGDHTCKMQLMREPFSVGPNTIVFHGVDGISTYYVFSLVEASIKTKEYKRHWSDFIKMEFVFANKNVMNMYHDNVEYLFAQCGILKRINRNLRTQRDLLLPKLISGEIDVSRAAATLAEAAE